MNGHPKLRKGILPYFKDSFDLLFETIPITIISRAHGNEADVSVKLA